MTRARNKTFIRIGYFSFIGWIIMLVIRLNFTQSITELFGTSGQVIIIVLMSLTGVLLLVFLMLLGILPQIYTWLYTRREKGFLKSMMEPYRFLLLED